MSQVWLIIVMSLVVAVTSSPIRTAETTTETTTASPKLLQLPTSSGSISLSDSETIRATTSSKITTASIDETPEHVTTAGSDVSVEQTLTESPFTRRIRSVTSEETQSAVETTMGPDTDEKIAATTSKTIVETTTAVVELDQDTLENAFLSTTKLLASVQYQMDQFEIPPELNITYLVDETARPMLPADVLDNANNCVQIQSILKSAHEMLQDFLVYSDGVVSHTGNESVRRHIRSTDRHVGKMIIQVYEYTSIVTGTFSSREEVIITLATLQKQGETLADVLFRLKGC